MSVTQQEIIDTLKAAMPEFTIRPLNGFTSGGLFDVRVGDRIAVELPEAHGNLRTQLHQELEQRTGLHFSSDSRSLDGACLDINDPQADLDTLRTAIADGKLSDLTIEYLDRVTPDKDKQWATAHRKNAGSFAEGLEMLGTAVYEGR